MILKEKNIETSKTNKLSFIKNKDKKTIKMLIFLKKVNFLWYNIIYVNIKSPG